jgi:hypothetical protein
MHAGERFEDQWIGGSSDLQAPRQRGGSGRHYRQFAQIEPRNGGRVFCTVNQEHYGEIPYPREQGIFSR